jgi:hypothetical protein
VLPTRCGIPWLGFVVYPTHRLLKRRNAVNFTRRLTGNLDAYRAGSISFAELDASVRGWINHVRYADTWGLRKHHLRDASDPGTPRVKASTVGMSLRTSPPGKQKMAKKSRAALRAAGEVSPAPPPESEYPGVTEVRGSRGQSQRTGEERNTTRKPPIAIPKAREKPAAAGAAGEVLGDSATSRPARPG